MKIRASLVVLALLINFVVPLSLWAEGPQDAEVIALVNKAVSIWEKKGRDYAIKVINASAGPLRKGTLYAFALDFKGVVVAQPVQPKMRGMDTWDMHDDSGNYHTQELVKEAQKPDGAGWVEYGWKRVNEPGLTKKRTYVKRVPGEDVLVACGYYIK